MKLTHVTFRDSIHYDGKGTVNAKDCQREMELHPAGVLVHMKGKEEILVPFSNVKWIGVVREAAAPAARSK